MSRFLNGIKSFVHSISTSDHYAAYDPSRPAGEDAAPLTTAGGDRRSSSSSLNSAAGGSAASGYVPGMRSAQMTGARSSGAQATGQGDAGIPLADIAPIPSAELSWARIDSWIEQNYPELYDQLLEGATENDLNDLEHDLDCVLPADVRESIAVHDGQEPGGKPTGVFFGIALLDLEGISEEWNVWRRTSLRIEDMIHRRQQQLQRQSPQADKPGPSSLSNVNPTGVGNDSLAWMEKQRSVPAEAVQAVYAHPGWIPLAKDFDGNNIGVDLVPGPRGRVGQVILFGRDFDTKYVIAPSWGDFLAQFAADLESGNSYIDDDIEDAVFAFKAPTGQLTSYFTVLRQRALRAAPKQPAPAGGAHASPSQQQQHHHQQQPRRNVMSASVSLAPVNLGRTTPRLISPTSSSTSLQLQRPASRTQLAEPGSAKSDSASSKADSGEPQEALSEVSLNSDSKQASPKPPASEQPKRSVTPSKPKSDQPKAEPKTDETPESNVQTKAEDEPEASADDDVVVDLKDEAVTKPEAKDDLAGEDAKQPSQERETSPDPVDSVADDLKDVDLSASKQGGASTGAGTGGKKKKGKKSKKAGNA